MTDPQPRETHRMTTPYYDPPRTPQFRPPAPKSKVAKRLTITTTDTRPP
jgi:hypothetical protein